MLLLIAMPMAAQAQLLDVQPGVRVRVRSPGALAGRVEGTVIARDKDSIVVATPQAVQFRLALASITDLAVSRGKSRSLGARRGALWTSAITAPILILGVGFDSSLTSSEKIGFVAFGTGVYAGIGALVGMAIGAEAWSSHTLQPAVTVGSKGAARLGGRFTF
jgi:hypothetical protein